MDADTQVHKPRQQDTRSGFFGDEGRSSASSWDAEKSAIDGLEPDVNVLSNYSEAQVRTMGRNYALKYGMDPELFSKAAAVARRPSFFNSMEFLSDDEKESLFEEAEHPWRLSGQLYWLIVMASMGAAVQGMDETVINGAQLQYPSYFGIAEDTDRNTWLIGLINSAPYLCCSTISCWMSDWLNEKLSRRGTIFWTCFVSAITCIWSGLTNNWWHLFISRFFLGFGIGPKSSTIPVYSSECAPPKIRGSLVMMWQVWTAFGIMFGYVMSLAFYRVPSHSIHKGLGWRLMLGSAALPAILVMLQVWFCPESPRWLMGKGRHREAFDAYSRIRKSPLQAARDTFYTHVLLLEESSYEVPFWTKVKEIFTVRRNRNGAVGAWVVMFMQQFCGINVIAYYSSSIFKESGFSERDALLASWGYGMINWVFALPAFFSIDRFGRRTLLLFSFPLMSIFLLLAGFAFWIPDEKARVGVIALGIYLFTIVYASSEGPVPFTYSAECAALYVRDVTMSFATATCWFFNFILSLTWPSLLKAFTPQGAFGWYAAWNMVGFLLVLWLLPETKGLALEELDDVFDVPSYKHAAYQTRHLANWVQRTILRRDIPKIEPLYRQQRVAVHNQEWVEMKHEGEHIE
ncbi:hypothetical protein KL918_000631 [Ogataea parapolymorpha]|uniref:Myo-inositol transporter n=1 Tax=Ogataea parapolymorpha (strain ATCC 26012 / BCRC 20466 / JCM 22074 / NRRL Y-7560 / DL-1) TaxID=871575 RepID=W1Q8A2_OGAPD|nr:Myo-inositol transporter [Ogataea parapolymorpha DL-1]ESW97020.1 Myo-inositol transporter [Ogataea parapolymorpha DL-1]KAG7869086.1 hypothetical protein KL918_000631 [Ogataea parapolymorpha]KAG7875864.1 hypothetical protein KL916_000535 [Ogataea parapolymorpha]